MGRKMGNPNELKVVNVRLVKEPSLYSTEKIQSPEDAVRVIADELKTYPKECFSVLCLKTNGQPICFNIASLGTIDSAIASPRDGLCQVIVGRIPAIFKKSSFQLLSRSTSARMKQGSRKFSIV